MSAPILAPQPGRADFSPASSPSRLARGLFYGRAPLPSSRKNGKLRPLPVPAFIGVGSQTSQKTYPRHSSGGGIFERWNSAALVVLIAWRANSSRALERRRAHLLASRRAPARAGPFLWAPGQRSSRRALGSCVQKRYGGMLAASTGSIPMIRILVAAGSHGRPRGLRLCAGNRAQGSRLHHLRTKPAAPAT